MQHNIKTVASNHRFDIADFVSFCTQPKNMQKFGIVEDAKDYWTVSTWHSNDLVDAYRKEECPNKQL